MAADGLRGETPQSDVFLSSQIEARRSVVRLRNPKGPREILGPIRKSNSRLGGQGDRSDSRSGRPFVEIYGHNRMHSEQAWGDSSHRRTAPIQGSADELFSAREVFEQISRFLGCQAGQLLVGHQ